MKCASKCTVYSNPFHLIGLCMHHHHSVEHRAPNWPNLALNRPSCLESKHRACERAQKHFCMGQKNSSMMYDLESCITRLTNVYFQPASRAPQPWLSPTKPWRCNHALNWYKCSTNCLHIAAELNQGGWQESSTRQQRREKQPQMFSDQVD